MQGAGQVQFELRGLKNKTLVGLCLNGRGFGKTLLLDEQYDPRLFPLRPIMYKLLLYLEIPQEFFKYTTLA